MLTGAPVQTLDLSAPGEATEDGQRPDDPPPAPQRWRNHPADARRPITLPRARLRLRGHDAELTIAPLIRPRWASAIGQDGAGLCSQTGGSERPAAEPPRGKSNRQTVISAPEATDAELTEPERSRSGGGRFRRWLKRIRGK